MITLLSKYFIKENMSAQETRKTYGMLCGGLGIFLNIALFIGKLIAGLLSGSIAIIADAFNNLSDAGSSIVTLLGFKIASQKPDAEHPYGHGRMEYIAGFVVSALILAMAFSLVKDSVDKIIHPAATTYSLIILIILLASILVKLYMAFYNGSVGKKIDSAAIRAAATDSISDSIATSVVLAATLIEHFLGYQIDGVCGLFVGLMIGYAGISAAKETLDPLLGQPPEKEFVDKIEQITMNFDKKIIGMHDLLVHDYGPGRRFISLHAEVPAEDNVLDLHEVIDALEHKLQTELGCFATVHMDPVVTNDPRVGQLKNQMKEILKGLDSRLTLHDFRVVFGENNSNIIFDTLAPMDFEPDDDRLKETIRDVARRELGPSFTLVIEVDRDYTAK